MIITLEVTVDGPQSSVGEGEALARRAIEEYIEAHAELNPGDDLQFHVLLVTAQ